MHAGSPQATEIETFLSRSTNHPEWAGREKRLVMSKSEGETPKMVALSSIFSVGYQLARPLTQNCPAVPGEGVPNLAFDLLYNAL
jgi:hypothetical protein